MNVVTLIENTTGRTHLLAEWGLSILVQLDGMTVLLDSGESGSVIHNASELGIDLRTIDKIVLSHGHCDHTGGLRELLMTMRKQVEIIAHPDIWDAKYVKRPGEAEYSYIGVPFQKEELESLGASFTLTSEPVWISNRMVTTGEIPLVSGYEKIDRNLYVKREGLFQPDPLRDDMALVIKGDRGLLVIAGCAHRGIVNALHRAQKLTEVDAIDTVLGGTHLIRATQEQIELTIAEMKGFGIKRLGACHCTGFHASARLAREFGDAFLCRNSMIMSSEGLDRNVLFPRKMVKNRHLVRRCLNGRRTIGHEPEGTCAPGYDEQGRGKGNDNQGGSGGDGDKLPAGSADIQTVCE